MSDVLIYDNCTLEMNIADEWYEVLCQVEMSFELTQEVILKTSVNSGLFREKATRLTEGACSVRGITPLENGDVISFFYIAQESIRTQPQTIRLKFIDQEGSSKQISGTAIISKCGIESRRVDFATASIDFEFSGDISIEDVPDPTGGGSETTVYSDWWSTTAGQNYISGSSSVRSYSLVGKTILEVDRSGDQYDLIANNSTPGNRQCSWNTSTNRLVFQYDFESNETVFVIFR
jgi:hypothetical protein